MKLQRLILTIAFALAAAAAVAAPPTSTEAASMAAYKTVDIDDYAAKHRPVKEGTRTLLPPQYLLFDAHIDQPPRTARTDYVRLAMSVMGIVDAPAIGHQMLLATPGGRRLPVYVEDTLVSLLTKAAAAQPDGQFQGYHIYTYSKGPAIVISGYRPKR